MVDELIARSPGADHYPSSWGRWCDCIKAGKVPADAGFGGANVHVNRFAARFRLARAFGGVTLFDYSADTAAGYNAFFRLVLTWASFEAYLRALGTNVHSCEPWLSSHLKTDVLSEVRRIDRGNALFAAIAPSLKGMTRSRIDEYLGGGAISYAYLGAAVRHHFVHGELTPRIMKVSPVVSTKVSAIVTDALLSGIDEDFTSRATSIWPPGA